MKRKIILPIIALFIAGITVVSCSGKQENGKTTEPTSEISSDSTTTAKTGVYTCPMGCLDGKTYDHPGKCEHCGMNLVMVEQEKSTDSEQKKGDSVITASTMHSSCPMSKKDCKEKMENCDMKDMEHCKKEGESCDMHMKNATSKSK